MDFATALTYMKRGHSVTRPEWGGYWYWKDDETGIMIVTWDNKEFPLSESTNWTYTLDFITKDGWEIYNGDTLEESISKRLRASVLPKEVHQQHPDAMERIRAFIMQEFG